MEICYFNLFKNKKLLRYNLIYGILKNVTFIWIIRFFNNSNECNMFYDEKFLYETFKAFVFVFVILSIYSCHLKWFDKKITQLKLLLIQNFYPLIKINIKKAKSCSNFG